jgi:excisionase family DNA binding protein
MDRHSDIEKWASMGELLDYLDVSREAVLRWINNRGMPAHKVGRLWKFKFSEVDEWIRSGGAEDHEKDKNQEDTDNG